MFSGIIEESAKVVSISKGQLSARLVIDSSLDHKETKLGDSIAIDGVCLTVTALSGARLEFDVGSETVRRTSLVSLKPGDLVNLERSLKLGARIHGHFVSGHVDSTVALLERVTEGNTEKFVWELPSELSSFIAPKVSVALSGISLTVGDVSNNTFCVYVIPHTSTVTTIMSLKVGQRLNLEVDILARYVETILAKTKRNNDADLLKKMEEFGFMTAAGGRSRQS